jgi:CheY-like chemotaxis protein
MRQGGTLTVTTTALDLREPRTEDGVIVPAGQYLVLSVADTGVGMVASTRAHVFEPFFSTKGHRGTGLGLATVYGLVEQSGGLITVDSEPDRETCFRVYLPTVDDAPTAGPLLYHRPAVAPSAHILLVEDDDGVRYLVSTLLRREGYSVVEAGHPADGLRLAQSSARPFQLLISDMVMPGMHGRALAENVTRLHPDAGILFITGYADQVVDAGHALLQKPFTSDEILWNVRETLRRAPAAGRASDTAIAG